ncbi:MAG: alpha/beta hydrolase [Rhodocyclaceae bacterium]|nr:alpha/beta hydrolase [Rhodocyclaceae bacterium]MCB1961784.1 alpha/beta hydrolase [Rhodocyclaceae bacterium]
MTARRDFVEVGADRIEIVRIGATDASRPTLVFVHEGLGCVAMWRDFPQQLCARTGCAGVVYSRAGYGRSSPARGVRGVDYLHLEALEALPALLDTLQLARPVLVGHSDGGSIALIHAAQAARAVAGLVVMAPHEFVEAVTLEGIRAARAAWAETDLQARLARYHDDPGWVFHSWNDTWLMPAFRSWNIEACLPAIDCPVLAIQGEDDEYATLRQIEVIAQTVPGATQLALAQCGHSPHRDQPEAVIGAIGRFIDTLE